MKWTTAWVNAIAAAVLTTAMMFTLFLAQRAVAQTTELRLLCSNGVKEAIEELRPQMEHAAGKQLAIVFDSSQRLATKIEAGGPFDLVIVAQANMDPLIQKGMVAKGSTVAIGRTGIGIGIRAGARKPDISTPEALKQTLLNAKSIAMNPTGAGAVHFNRIVADMGITNQMKPKIVPNSEPGGAQMDVAQGKAELVWTQIPEVKAYRELELAGPLPAALQIYTDFSIAVAAKPSDAAAADAVIKFIGSSAAKAAFKAKDVEVRAEKRV